ncbi:MAG: response regulator transcription factor [Chloroflexi bacterium]|nr:response regulator transcription factor [Chloroflexota bacterium]
MERTSIVIVETHAVFRQLLAELLASEPEFDVVGEVDGASGAAERVRELAPDVAVVDINLGGSNGLDVSRAIRLLCPTTRVLILVEEDSVVYTQAVRECGASALVRKAAIVAALVPSLRQLTRKGMVDEVTTE